MWSSLESGRVPSFLPVVSIALLLLSAVPAGATDVSGAILSDTTWILAGSPYRVVGNIVVFDGVRLTIEPDVEVRFQADKALQVDGELIAQGLGESPIVFTSDAVLPSAGDWGYIHFTDTSTDAVLDSSGNYASGSVLQHTVIEYAGGLSVSNNGALRIEASAPLITQSTIRWSAVDGISIFNQESLIVSNCVITENQGWGIAISTEGSLVVEILESEITGNAGGIYANGDVLIIGNSIRDNTGGVGPGVFAMHDSTIQRNEIVGNDGGGINAYYYDPGGWFTPGTYYSAAITENLVQSNARSGNWAGIASDRADVVEENLIVGNVSTDGWGGLTGGAIVNSNVFAENTGGLGGGFSPISQTTEITGNSFVRNTVDDGASSALQVENGNDLSFNTFVGNHRSGAGEAAVVRYVGTSSSVITGNTFFANAGYALHNDTDQGNGDITAEDNWWGTTDMAEINGLIYDFFDNATKTLVDFVPLLTAPHTDAPITPPVGVSLGSFSPEHNLDSTLSITMSWSLNPETDLAGYKVYYDYDPGYPYDGSGADQGPSPVDVGLVTEATLSGLPSEGPLFLVVTAYDLDANGIDDFTDGTESWFSEELIVTEGIFADGFESGDTSAWSEPIP